MLGSKKIPIDDLNQYITCKICKGYFVDATTIIECLHTFCRSCIVRYLQSNKYCPVCDVQVHKSKPLLNIRPDKTVQDVVYKLVPRLFQNEMQRRRDFYSNHPEAKPSSLEQCGEASYQHLLTPEETVCLTLSYHGSNSNPRYLRCPAAVSLGHLQKLIRAKYGLKDSHRVDILYNQDCLNSSLTLMDVAYIYLWKRKGPIELTYRIYECAVKKIKVDPDATEESLAPVNCVIADNNNINNNNNNWKEVQLRISENGEMSITGIDTNLDSSLLEIVNSEPKYKNDVVTVVQTSSVTTHVTNGEDPQLNSPEKVDAVPETPNTTVETPTINNVHDDAGTVSTSSLGPVTLNIPILGLPPNTRPSSDLPIHHVASSSACLSSATTTTVYSTINKSKCSTKTDDSSVKIDSSSCGLEDNCEKINQKPDVDDVVRPQDDVREIHTEVAVSCNNVPRSIPEISLKRRNDDDNSPCDGEPPSKQPKQNALNHGSTLLNLSNNHPLKKHSKMNRNGENVKNSSPKVVILEHDIILPSCSAISVAKQTILNKIMPIMHSTKPSTTMSLSKSIMSTKASIIPPKLPSTTYAGQKAPCYMPKTTFSPVLNVPKPVTVNASLTNSLKSDAVAHPSSTCTSTATTSKTDTKLLNVNSPQQSHISNSTSKPPTKTKSTTPIGYKTLRDPPKSWNSQISKANFNKVTPDQKYSELKNVRPKFFKMRNNMPRYLGAPASGVKPMYQVNVSPEKDKTSEPAKTEKNEIKKHSIVKIDPKTLRPISEKAPETTSLSNHSSSCNSGLPNSHNNSVVAQNFSTAPSMTSNSLSNLQTELKINTSSVSIFNPLKLQSSPKNDRKSPKSPQSPKLKSTNSPTSSATSNSSSSSKRDKVNVTFTPPNPFVPRLASPTLGPAQFLYPPPAYDPRVMAAYTSLWYGQRLAEFAGGAAAGLPHPGIALDLNAQITQQQRKNFELLAAAHTAQMASKAIPITPSISPISRIPNLPPVPKPATTPKKKESKSEKSLETTLEKLTQNRHKELNSRTEPCEESKPNPEETPKSKTKGKSIPEKSSDSRTETAGSRNQTTVSPSTNERSKTTTPVPEPEKSRIEDTRQSESPTRRGNTNPTVSTNPSETNRSAISLPNPDGVNSVTPLRTVTSDNKAAECGNDFKVAERGSDFKVAERVSNFKVAGCASDFKVAERSSDFKVAERGSDVEVAERSSDLKVAERGSDLTVAERGSDVRVAESGSDLKVAEGRSDQKVAKSVGDTVKSSQSIDKNSDGNSGSKSLSSSSSVERNNDLSDNKISEKLVEGGE